jgi:hypothetical protein
MSTQLGVFLIFELTCRPHQHLLTGSMGTSGLRHDLALRRHDLRPMQLRLAALGLSSLGRAESHVLATVDAVLGVLLAT